MSRPVGSRCPAAIEKRLDDESDATRIAAAGAHWSVLGEVKRAKRTLVAIASDRSSSNRREAIQALGEMDAEDLEDVEPLLVAAVGNGTIETVYDALELLVKFDPFPGEYLALAVRRARDASGLNLVESLISSMTGTRAQSAIPSLIPLVKDWDVAWRVAAIEALGAIGAEPKRVVPVLIEALEDRVASVRAAAVIALKSFRAGHGSVSHLLRVTTDRDPDVRGTALYILACLGLRGQKLVDVIVAGLDDPHHSVRQDAVHALSELGVASKPVIDALENASRGGDATLREIVPEVLEELRSASRSK